MRLLALCIARNESWCLQATATAALRFCDSIVILDHASDDRTPDIIQSLANEYGPDRVIHLSNPSPDWREQDDRQATLDHGRLEGGTHFVILDADEMLSENLVSRIRPMIEQLRPGQIMQLPWVALWRSMDRYRSDPTAIAQGWKSMAFADHPTLCWKPQNGYHHHHTHPHNGTWAQRRIGRDQGGWLHLQFVNWERLLWKQRLYVMREVIAFGAPKANYAGTVSEIGLAMSPVPAEWWGPERVMIDVGAPPWQEAECKRLVEQHGPGRFIGHDLFGWVPTNAVAAA